MPPSIPPTRRTLQSLRTNDVYKRFMPATMYLAADRGRFNYLYARLNADNIVFLLEKPRRPTCLCRIILCENMNWPIDPAYFFNGPLIFLYSIIKTIF